MLTLEGYPIPEVLREEGVRLTAILGETAAPVILHYRPESAPGSRIQVEELDPVPVHWSWIPRPHPLIQRPPTELQAVPDGLPLPPPGWILMRPHVLSLTNVLSSWMQAAESALEAGAPVPKLPATRLLQAWQGRSRATEPYLPAAQGSLPRLNLLRDKHAELPDFPTLKGPPRQPYLPGFEPKIEQCPSWLLWLFDVAGGDSMSQGRGAPWEMRLFVGALLHLAVGDRDGQWRTILLPTEVVIGWLHPGTWHNRRRDWDKFPAALDTMRERLGYMPIPGIGSVALVFPSVIPQEPTDPYVEFTVRIPAAAASGARIDWGRLRRYGKDSAAQYRAYLAITAHLDRSAHKGHPITREIGAPILRPDGTPKRRKGGQLIRSTEELIANPAAQYVPLLTDADLARLVGLDHKDRDQRRKSRRALEHLRRDRVIDLRREDGGWRIYGPQKRVMPPR